VTPVLAGTLRAGTSERLPHAEWVVVARDLRWAMFFQYADEDTVAFAEDLELDPWG
jgi:hypothetical protein